MHTVNCENLTTEEKCSIKQATVARLVQFLFEPCLVLGEWTHSSFARGKATAEAVRLRQPASKLFNNFTYSSGEMQSGNVQ